MSATGTLQPSVEGLTAYRYGSTHVLIITVRKGIDIMKKEILLVGLGICGDMV